MTAKPIESLLQNDKFMNLSEQFFESFDEYCELCDDFSEVFKPGMILSSTMQKLCETYHKYHSFIDQLHSIGYSVDDCMLLKIHTQSEEV